MLHVPKSKTAADLRIFYPVPLNQLLNQINQAIWEKKYLSITTGSRITYKLEPAKIAYDSIENLYSLIAFYRENLFVQPFDRIYSCSILKQKSSISAKKQKQILSIAPNVWGCSFTDPPEHVKIRFYNEANVYNKVRQELVYRTNGRLYEQDGFLYYEDTVYGIKSFKSWIYGYGSSAVVLEPLSLRQEILDELKARQMKRLKKRQKNN